MFARQERVAVLLLAVVALAVVAAHLVLAGVGKQPFARPFTSESKDGELVAVEGEIGQVTPTRTGGHVTVTVNNLSVFLPAGVAEKAAVKKGDRVSVYGTVQTFRGKKEIVVNAPEDIRILPALSPKLPEH